MIIREFGIKDVRYVNSCIALVGETAICFLSNPAQESLVASLEFTLGLLLAWHDLDGSFHSLSPPPTHPS